MGRNLNRIVAPGKTVTDPKGRVGVVKTMGGNLITIEYPETGEETIDIREKSVSVVE